MASFVLILGAGYTAGMMRLVLTVLLLIVAAWFCLTILPGMIANMLSGAP
jgi:hypothetical protein